MEDIYKDYYKKYQNIGTLKRIIFGQTYKEVGNIPTKENIRYTNAKLNADQVKEIRKRYKEENTSFAKLRKDYGVTAGVIGGIIQGKSYKHIE